VIEDRLEQQVEGVSAIGWNPRLQATELVFVMGGEALSSLSSKRKNERQRKNNKKLNK
jgi:hypothetical protein